MTEPSLAEQIAELRGWERFQMHLRDREKYKIPDADCKLFGFYVPERLGGVMYCSQFDPERHAAQAMVLFEELPAVGLCKVLGTNRWECGQFLEPSWHGADNPLTAICLAWLAYMKANASA